jgi:hypothetical protein
MTAKKALLAGLSMLAAWVEEEDIDLITRISR